MKYYVIDVFTDELFKGNPAGVCILNEWLADSMLQKIAFENNLSETAFLVEKDEKYELRWFTPKIEVDLCGHATLASAYVIFNYFDINRDEVYFSTISGLIKVYKKNEYLYLDFPSRPVLQCESFDTFDKAFGIRCKSVFKAVDFLILVDNEQILLNLRPDFNTLKQIKKEVNIIDDSFGVIVTAKGNDCDFVSRFFAPNAGINEDPVTGRAYCSLIPFWSKKLGKSKMTAKQLSERSGFIVCENAGNRVKIGGKAVCYLIGNITI